MTRDVFDVNDNKINEEKRRKRSDRMHLILLASIIAIGIIILFFEIVILIESIQTIHNDATGKHVCCEHVESVINYDYYDKFCQILKDTSPSVYNDCSEEFMRQEYEIWYTNRGYADIIIDMDGNLTTVFSVEETIDILNHYLLTGEK